MNREQQWRSYSSFGLFREDNEAVRRVASEKSRRFRLSFAVVAVALLIVTGVFIALQVTKSTREGVAKAKRFAEEERRSPEEVELIPEEEAIHPNHRYDRGETNHQVVERMMKDTYREWPEEDERNNIRDIIKRIEMREKLRKGAEKRNPRGMGKPILFKGVYTKKAKTDGVSSDDSDREYFKEINEMLMGEEKSSTEEKRVHSLRGSPFQLKNHAAVGEDPTTEEARRKAKKPITVMLDIYPITKPEDDSDEPGRKEKRQDAAPFFREPVPTGGRNIPVAVHPDPSRQTTPRIIMKLNLYPKARDETRLTRRAFGWFKKDPEPHVCRLFGRPSWKPVTAEWKDEHGDWVKANYVTLKYWDRK